jgi:hypothetical protein
MLWGFLRIISAVISIVGLTIEGYLPEFVTIPLLVIFVLFEALKRALGGVTGCIYYIFLTFIILILAVTVTIRGGGLQNVLPIILNAFETGLEWIVGLILKGYIGPRIGVGLLVVLFILYLLRKRFGITIMRTFLIALPIFTLLAFASIHAGGRLPEVGKTLAYFIGLFVLLGGLYLMFYGFFRPK